MGSDLKEEGGGGSKTGIMDGLSPVSSTTRVFWNSRKRSANGERLQKRSEDTVNELSNKPMADNNGDETDTVPALSERRKALFEPLEPVNGRYSAESLLPPPDFDSASYPKGWLVGKKRKLVNVDVVESMRRIAVQEMNRKDREIDGLNEQLDEDARALEHMQLQLLQERSKRADVERENGLLQNQISMLMDMLHGGEGDDDDGTDDS